MHNSVLFIFFSYCPKIKPAKKTMFLRGKHSFQKSANFQAIMSLANKGKSDVFDVTQNIALMITNTVRKAKNCH